ncbi:MAG: tetratricopeptide repeat protein, partial [Candidatus Riflebacteria bacterium]|nr:tetratricopeptide repeat protein [Candidatus Riflebacteria bacterium]
MSYFAEEKIFDSEKVKCDRLFREALDYSRNIQYFKAIPILKEIFAISPKNLTLINELCYCLFEQNKTKEAKELAYKGLELAQSFSIKFYIPKFYSLIARYYKEVSDFKTAIKYYKLALVRDYFNLEINYSLADCYVKINEYDKALNLFKRIRASEDEKDDKIGFSKLKEYAAQQNKKVHPELAHIELGDKYFSNKQNKLALIEYESANKIVPENVRVLEKLFDVKIKLGLNKEAIKTGLEITSKDIDIIKKYYDGHGEFILLSKVYYELFNCYKNTWHFIKTKEASSMFDYYQKILRGNYEYVFSKDKCISSLKEAYESKPNRYEALEELVVYLSLFKEYEKSLKYASIGLEMAKAEKNIN